MLELRVSNETLHSAANSRGSDLAARATRETTAAIAAAKPPSGAALCVPASPLVPAPSAPTTRVNHAAAVDRAHRAEMTHRAHRGTTASAQTHARPGFFAWLGAALGLCKPAPRSYAGQWALVTGASSGIGACFAQELARRGANVLLAARGESGLRRLRQLRERRGGELPSH